MKQLISILIFISVITFPGCSDNRDIEDEKYLNFLSAIENQSTFNYFTVVTVKNLNSGEVKEICTKGNFVSSALHIEINADYDGVGESKVLKYASLRKDRYFKMANKKALDNISFFDNPKEKLTDFEREYDFNKVVAIIQRDKKFSIRLSSSEKMKMFAQVLFNKGYMTGENDCFGGTLEYVERTENNASPVTKK